jgi:hypothetical protein
MDWKNTVEIVYYIAGAIGALGTFGAALVAVYYYYQNSQLERAKWASTLYEKFYEGKSLKPIRDRLDDEEANSDYVRKLVFEESTDFTDYLNFFEFIAFLRKSKQLERAQVEDLFGFYLDCLEKHSAVAAYVRDPAHGYEGLAGLMQTRESNKQLMK